MGYKKLGCFISIYLCRGLRVNTIIPIGEVISTLELDLVSRIQ